ncbi:MAG: penicillin amidase, partial [Acidobacteriaceae bacterium]|nr:penicillin amidase [Acidobacteriaceae bacterium]
MRSVRRVLISIFLILLIAAGTAIWWFVYRPLPQVDGIIVVNGLHGDVTVERDRWGIPHIRASSPEDMVEAQGYVMAQDRLWQMDLLRRVGRGQLSEIFGPALLSVDKKFRTLGFGPAAEREATTVTG